MYARRIKGKNQSWGFVFQPSKYLFGPNISECACARPFSHASALRNHLSNGSLIRRSLLDSVSSRCVVPRNSYTGLEVRSSLCFQSIQSCAFSSEGDGRNASENNHKPINEGANFDKGDKGKNRREIFKENVRHCDAHARLGDIEQKEWLNNEKLAIESKKKESPFLTRRERFKNEFSRRVVPWEKINISWETFPYYIQ